MQENSFAHIGHSDASHDHKRSQNEALSPSFSHKSFIIRLPSPVAKGCVISLLPRAYSYVIRRRHIEPRNTEKQSTWYVPV